MSERPIIVFDVNETRFSVDETVKRHKPAQEAYQSWLPRWDSSPGTSA